MTYESIINILDENNVINKTTQMSKTEEDALDYGLSAFTGDTNVLSVRIFAYDNNKPKQIMEFNRTPFAINY